MTGQERRDAMIEIIQNSEKPVSGTALAKQFAVSRQVIVQDIALIRAAGYEVLSTHRGYLLGQKNSVTRIFKVSHTDEEIADELNLIVDLGGKVLDVQINHKVYGRMKADLGIHSRKQVQDFIEEIRSGKSSPLKNITSNYHYHTVEADSEEVLDLIGKELNKRGYLVSH
mgnify:FL=1